MVFITTINSLLLSGKNKETDPLNKRQKRKRRNQEKRDKKDKEEKSMKKINEEVRASRKRTYKRAISLK